MVTFKVLIARLNELTKKIENFAFVRSEKKNRSKQDNTILSRPPITIDKEYEVRQTKVIGKKKLERKYKLPKGTVIRNVQSIARGKGIDYVQKLIDTYSILNSKAEDWEKLKGISIVYDKNSAYKAEIHFYKCQNHGYYDFKVKYILGKLS